MLARVGSYVRRNHLALLALFVALGGTSAYAVNEWTGANIQDGTLTGADIQDLSLGLPDYGANSISTGKLKDQDVRTQDLRDLGVTNSKIAWDSVSSGKVINNNLLGDDIRDGEVARELFGQNLPSGRTLRGLTGDQAAVGTATRAIISFAVRAPSVPSVGSNQTIGDTAADPDCTGSYNEPTAPPGKVCVYWGDLNGDDVVYFATRDGVAILHAGNDVAPVVRAAWAYTAP
jgi:hypothetical protein